MCAAAVNAALCCRSHAATHRLSENTEQAVDNRDTTAVCLLTRKQSGPELTCCEPSGQKGEEEPFERAVLGQIRANRTHTEEEKHTATSTHTHTHVHTQHQLALLYGSC